MYALVGAQESVQERTLIRAVKLGFMRNETSRKDARNEPSCDWF